MNGNLWPMNDQHAPAPGTRQSAAVPLQWASITAQRTNGTRTTAPSATATRVRTAPRMLANDSRTTRNPRPGGTAVSVVDIGQPPARSSPALYRFIAAATLKLRDR